MPKFNLRSRRNSFIKHQLSNIDVNDLSALESKQSPIKVIVVNGKCTEIFKSSLEDCVEDCILEFPEEQNSVYVSKSGQVTQIPIGSNRNFIALLREANNSARQSAKSTRRRNSINQHNAQQQMSGTRTNATSNFSLPTVALAATTAARTRHQLVQQKFSLVEDISEEQTIILQPPRTPMIEPGIVQAEHPSILLPDDSISPVVNPDTSSFSFPSLPSAKRHVSYRDRYKDYRLSDLVVLGPEPFTHIFNLPRHHSQLRQRDNKLTELDQIKQDLFHRYLWTQKPQVSCRIRSLSTYARRATLAI